jgi:lipopolysaccharide heptosyltransferase II
MGDVLMTTPAFRAIRETNPRCRITLLTSPAGAEVAALVPEIDDVIVYEAPWMKTSAANPERDRAFIEELERRNFDAAIIFTVATQNPLPAAFACYLAGIPLRAAHCRENPYWLLTDWSAETDGRSPVRHEVQRQLDLVGELGFHTEMIGLSLRVTEAARREARLILQDAGIDLASAWAIIHTGASAPSRRYPAALFAKVAAALASRHGWQVVFTGSTGECGLVEGIRASMHAPSVSLAGRLDVATLAGVIDAAPLLIANNTGPVHIAAAVGTPVVDIYAQTNLQHTPWAVAHRLVTHEVPCSGCLKSICPELHHACLTAIPPQEVVEAAQDLMNLRSNTAKILDVAV